MLTGATEKIIYTTTSIFYYCVTICVGHKMNNQSDPEQQETPFNPDAAKALEQLSLQETEAKVDRFLYEAMDACKDYIAGSIRDAYCQHKKVAILPPFMVLPIKARAEELFLARFHLFSEHILPACNQRHKESDQ